MTMDYKQFQEWLSGIDQHSPAQWQQSEAVFPGASDTSASLAAVEASVGEDRQCAHCGTPGAVSRGKARGLSKWDDRFPAICKPRGITASSGELISAKEKLCDTTQSKSPHRRLKAEHFKRRFFGHIRVEFS